MSTGFDAAAFEALLQLRLRCLVHQRINSGPRDKAVVIRAVDKIYFSLGLKPPVTVWCQDISQVIRLPLLFYFLSMADLLALAELKKIVRKHLAVPSFEQLWSKVGEHISTLEPAEELPCIGRSLDDQFLQELKKFDDEIKSLIRTINRVQLATTLFRMLRFADGQLQAAIRFSAPVQPDNLLAELKILLTMLPIASQEANFEQIARLTGQGWANLWGVWSMHAQLESTQFLRSDLAVLSAFESNRRQAGKTVDDVLPWFDLFEGAFAYQFFENYCFVCEIPSKIAVDKALRLHCESGPAIAFSNSQKLYAWHGTPIPENLIEQKKRISPISIKRQQNVELRRIMIEIYGVERFMRNSKARLIQQDQFGTLYRINLVGGEPLVVLAVSNATAEPDGTRRRYTLRVPPAMRTAKEAVAWTFGLESEEYDPKMES